MSEKPTGSYEISNFSSGVPDEEYAIVPITGRKICYKSVLHCHKEGCGEDTGQVKECKIARGSTRNVLPLLNRSIIYKNANHTEKSKKNYQLWM